MKCKRRKVRGRMAHSQFRRSMSIEPRAFPLYTCQRGTCGTCNSAPATSFPYSHQPYHRLLSQHCLWSRPPNPFSSGPEVFTPRLSSLGIAVFDNRTNWIIARGGSADFLRLIPASYCVSVLTNFIKKVDGFKDLIGTF